MTSQEVVHDIFTHRLTPTAAPVVQYFSRPNILTWKSHTHTPQQDWVTNTQQDLLIPKIKLPLDMQDFWLVGLFCQKTTKSLILTFNILAQVLVN
jgi:hypothetical protein